MKKTFKTTLIAAISTIAIAASAQAKELTEERVNELIKDYLYNNPSTIVDALQKWQIEEEANRVKEQVDAVQRLRATAFKSEHFPRAGNPKGDVTIIEFFDYNCPACKMMFESLDTVMKADDNLNVILVEYPIFGPQSDTNAKIGLAVYALAPKKYFDFHTGMMRHKGKITADDAFKIAGNLGIDVDTLKAEIEKPEYDEMLKKDRDLAAELKIQGTPALIVEDKITNSAVSAEDLKAQIRWARGDKDK